MAMRPYEDREQARVVLPLFENSIVFDDPLQALYDEADAEIEGDPFVEERADFTSVKAESLLVSPGHFPEQSVHILEKQIATIKETLGRIKFYLEDLDDLIPR